jgi:hypothetical protein
MPLSQVFTHVYQPWNDFGNFFTILRPPEEKKTAKKTIKEVILEKNQNLHPLCYFIPLFFDPPWN